jgi:pyruvate dehydrogenase E2 component (dihydrolipoamide acetyltransferase)
LIGQLDAKGGATASGGAAGSTELASAPSKPEKTAPKGAKETGTAEEPVSTSSLSLAESQKNAGTAAKAAPATSGGGAPSDLTVPDIGDFKDVEVIDVLVKAGDRIDVDTPLLTLETEKATMDVPSTAAGVLKSIALKKGDRISKGSLIGQLEVAGGAPAASAPAAPAAAPKAAPAPAARAEAPAPKPAAPAPQAAPAPAAPKPSAPIDEAGFARAYASPSVRKFARELGADLGKIKGTGAKGRITPDDVKNFVKQALTSAPAAAASGGGAGLPKIPEVDFSKFGEIELKPLSRIQKISGPRLQASWLNIPHVWQMDEADITDLEESRKKLKGEADKAGVKLTPLAFVLRACVKALKDFPNVNSSLDPAGQNLILKKYIHLGFAADTPNGLVVPVIRDADKKDVYEIAKDLSVLSEKARAGKLSAAEMQGATFTVSSLGGIGCVGFTPIINAPEVAILGVAKSSFKPVYKDGQFVPRLMLPFTLAYDHRVIDGAAGVRFTTFLAEKLADVRGLLEAVP